MTREIILLAKGFSHLFASRERQLPDSQASLRENILYEMNNFNSCFFSIFRFRFSGEQKVGYFPYDDQICCLCPITLSVELHFILLIEIRIWLASYSWPILLVKKKKPWPIY